MRRGTTVIYNVEPRTFEMVLLRTTQRLGMQVSRREAGGEALMVLTVDSAIPADALADIATRIGATSARPVDLSGA